jgi:hypothetical protein
MFEDLPSSIETQVKQMHKEIQRIFSILTAGRSKGSGVSSVMAVVALCGCTKQFDKAPICYVNRPLRAIAAAKYQQMMNYPG